MCLLKPTERATINCTHEECKHAQMFNRPSCLHNIVPASKPLNAPISANFTQYLPNQQKPLFQTVQFPENLGVQPLTVPKESLVRGFEEAFDEEETFTLNKKKVKVDSISDFRPSSYSMDSQVKSLAPNVNLQQYISNNNSADKMLFTPNPINNILINNSGMNGAKPENFQVMHLNQPLYVPFIQNTQSTNNIMNQAVSYMPYQQTNQTNFQTYPQNFKLNSYEPSINVSPTSNTMNVLPKENNSFDMEEFMKGVQDKFTELLFTQNKMLIDLREKNELVQDTLACLINEVNSLKQVVKQNHVEKTIQLEQNPIISHQMLETSREVATTDNLLNLLYGQKQDFSHQLVFKTELPLPLYRERNFKFTVLLTDKEGNPVKNINKIPLTLAIYTSECNPKFVDVNTSGNKILKGMIDKDMVDGSVTFDKIQIKEVTSHFRNGWVFFVVYPKLTMILNNPMAGMNGVVVNSNKIKPLVLEKVVVKAKRNKEKETTGEVGAEDSEIFEPEE